MWWSLFFAGAVIVLYALAVVTPLGQQRLDARGIGVTPAPEWFRAVQVGVPLLACGVGIFTVAVALRRRRWMDTVTCIVCAGGVTWLCGLLRDTVFVRPAYGALGVVNSYPSRHVVITCAVCVLIVRLWPWSRSSRIVERAAAVAVAVASVASLATYAHRASDTVGGVLLVGVFAASFARGKVPPVRSMGRMWSRAATMLAVVCLVAAALAWTTRGMPAYVGYIVLITTVTGCLTRLILRIAKGPAA